MLANYVGHDKSRHLLDKQRIFLCSSVEYTITLPNPGYRILRQKHLNITNFEIYIFFWGGGMVCLFLIALGRVIGQTQVCSKLT